MGYQVELPDQLKQQDGEVYVTLLIPQESTLPVANVDEQWETLADGMVRASYTRAQVREAVWAGLAIKIGQVEERLNQGERLIAEAQQHGDHAETERLEQHWLALLGQITSLLDAQVAARASIESKKR